MRKPLPQFTVASYEIFLPPLRSLQILENGGMVRAFSRQAARELMKASLSPLQAPFVPFALSPLFRVPLRDCFAKFAENSSPTRGRQMQEIELPFPKERPERDY